MSDPKVNQTAQLKKALSVQQEMIKQITGGDPTIEWVGDFKLKDGKGGNDDRQQVVADVLKLFSIRCKDPKVMELIKQLIETRHLPQDIAIVKIRSKNNHIRILMKYRDVETKKKEVKKEEEKVKEVKDNG